MMERKHTSIGRAKLGEGENGHELELSTITEKSTRMNDDHVQRTISE